MKQKDEVLCRKIQNEHINREKRKTLTQNIKRKSEEKQLNHRSLCKNQIYCRKQKSTQI